MTFLHSVFALAMREGLGAGNPVERAARPKRRRAGDADPDLQFLTLAELDAVIDAIPDHVVDRDALGPVLRVVILAAARPASASRSCSGCAGATSTSRAQRIRVRNAWVRYEHSGEGKSDLSTNARCRCPTGWPAS